VSEAIAPRIPPPQSEDKLRDPFAIFRNWKFIAAASVASICLVGLHVAAAITNSPRGFDELTQSANMLCLQTVHLANEEVMYEFKDHSGKARNLTVHLNSSEQNVKVAQGFFRMLTHKYLILSSRYNKTDFSKAYTETLTIPIESILYVSVREEEEEVKPGAMK
jgi:hypothetical protein